MQGLLKHNPSSGLGVVVEARVARMSYGVKYFTPFIAGKHKKKDKFWCGREKAHKANNQMDWFLKEVSK